MKKLIVTLLTCFIFILNVNAGDKDIVALNKCIDGDTASFNLNSKIIKVRFLAIDTPESVSTKVDKELYGEEASTFTCNLLSNADIIELEYDNNSDKLDKYNRYLAWVWVDNKLLQDEIISNGYAEVKYLYGEYKYTSLLQKHQKIAKDRKLNIWSPTQNKKEYEKIYIILAIIVFIVCFLTNKKFRNKIKNKSKKIIEKKIKDL